MNDENKILLSLKEVCDLTGWGESKTRRLLKSPSSTFTVRFGNRLYVLKDEFEKYLKKCATYGIDIQC